MFSLLYIQMPPSGILMLLYLCKNLLNWNVLCAHNCVVGFFGVILRVLFSLLFEILLLDTNVMTRGFQFADLHDYTWHNLMQS